MVDGNGFVFLGRIPPVGFYHARCCGAGMVTISVPLSQVPSQVPGDVQAPTPTKVSRLSGRWLRGQG
jgi:hypothetical protein